MPGCGEHEQSIDGMLVHCPFEEHDPNTRVPHKQCLSCKLIGVTSSYLVSAFVIYQVRTAPGWIKAKPLSRLCMYAIAFGANHTRYLDADKNYRFSWRITGDSIFVELVVRAQGWVGWGLSTNGAMMGSDMVVVWIDSVGKGVISDRYGITGQNGFPLEDAVQDYHLISATKNETHIIASFKRLLHTCDENDQDMDIGNSTAKVIWAYHATAPFAEGYNAYHAGLRGAKSLSLTAPGPTDPLEKLIADTGITDLSHFDIRLENITVPSDRDTLYWCKVFTMPKRDIHHILAYEMQITPGNEENVHHALLYRCVDSPSVRSRAAEPGGMECFGEHDERERFTGCFSDFIGGWAVGGEPYILNNSMGMPFFAEGDSPYVMMEMHYDNSRFHKNVVDNSGVRLYLTKQYRPVEAGAMILMAAPNPSQVIPPGQTSFKTTAYCHAGCTMGIDETGIHVFGALLHTHLLGRKARLRHFRQGVELPPIIEDNNYDFNYQTITQLSEPRLVLPGDELITECEYDTTDKTEATLGGDGTKQEMCMSFIHYYPRENAVAGGVCQTTPNVEMLAYLFGADYVEVGLSRHGTVNVNVTIGYNPAMSFQDFVKQITWTPANVEALEKYNRNGLQGAWCNTVPREMLDKYKLPHWDGWLSYDTYGGQERTSIYRKPDVCRERKGKPVERAVPPIASFTSMLVNYWRQMLGNA